MAQLLLSEMWAVVPQISPQKIDEAAQPPSQVYVHVSPSNQSTRLHCLCHMLLLFLNLDQFFPPANKDGMRGSNGPTTLPMLV